MATEKGHFKYFAVIQDQSKARFNRSFVYLNKREWTEPTTGIYQAAECLSITPGANGIYVVDMEADNAKKKIDVLTRVVKDGVHPVLGPFDSVEDAVIAERKVRPRTDKERVVQADADAAELATLRAEKAARA